MIETTTSTSAQLTRSSNNEAPGVRQSNFTATGTKANQLNDKPLSSKSLKRQRYNERKKARRLEKEVMDIDPTTIDNPTPTGAPPTNIPPPTAVAFTDPSQAPHPQSSTDFKLVDGVPIPIAEWRRAKKARLRARKAENRKRGREQQHPAAKEDATTQNGQKPQAASEAAMELDPDGLASATHAASAYMRTTGPHDDDDDDAAMGDDESSTSETQDGKPSRTVAGLSRAEVKRQKWMKMEAKRAKRERHRFFKSQST